MTTDDEIRTLPLATVIGRCGEETAKFRERRAHDARFCLELFRRAVEDGNQRAWNAVYARYAGQVRQWIRRRSPAGRSDDDVEAIANGVFARFWSAKGRNAFSFDSLPKLLSYLALCVAAEIVDDDRRRRRDALSGSEALNTHLPSDDDPEVISLGTAHAEPCWEAILQRATNERERAYLLLGMRLGFKPRQLVERYPELFPDVYSVNRTRANFLARLRRDDELRKICSDLFDDAGE